MTATAAPQPTATPTQGAREQYLDAFQQELATTMRLLRAYPADQLELRPAAICKTARELAWIFAIENGLCMAVLDGTLELPPKSAPPPPPPSWADELTAIDGSFQQLAAQVRAMPEDKLFETVRFYVAPKTLGDVPKIRILWMMLCDSIHHRGQLTIYTRMAGGIVPSIYGPTAEQSFF